MSKKAEPKLYRMYDPAAQAYRSVTKEDAVKLIEAAKEVEAQIKEDEKE